MRLTRIVMSVTAVALGIAAAVPAQASVIPDDTSTQLPAPGILGLVALGVVGAIMMARRSK